MGVGHDELVQQEPCVRVGAMGEVSRLPHTVTTATTTADDDGDLAAAAVKQ
jgi:hypothetical protein